MNVLSCDTSTSTLQLALESAKGLEEVMLTDFQHSEGLLGGIDRILTSHGLGTEDLDLLVCTRGPGSFTSLRIAMATLKGIALAGAEAAWCGAEGHDENDGILTADEVARFDLHGTRLVVLSACETALGNNSFEGVYGLPRGFKQAGVESLLVSLWSVNDRSTSLLMSEFYRYWLEGKPVREALEQAVREVRKQYPQPYYWAPFVLLD